ncbi:site-specific integrase [Sphingopyxis sp. 2PD]|uniref:tyrosine-type recombinase/integrase n=1 Tax=Sphingopyxis sp. 2PD TaxID=2502196 RepID=UPI0010F54E1B|nr:site-specific integrase [Sphingopyxis sp. 2PD]
MSIYKSPKSPFYSYDFQLNRRRFHGTTKARNKKDAEIVERQIKAQAKVDMEQERLTGNGPLTIDIATGRYWTEVGQYHSGSGDTWTNLQRLIDFFGSAKRLDEISDREVAALVAWRRAQFVMVNKRDEDGKLTQCPVRPLAPATVNRSTILPLRALFGRASRVWRYQLPMEPMWRDHMLAEPEERVRELHGHEAAALDLAIRPDYKPWFHFACLTGLRLDETLIRWSNVKWEAGLIVTTGKGGKIVKTHITDEVKDLLESLKGDHEEYVFTYICQRRGKGHVVGQRYPIGYESAKTQWRRTRERAKLVDFRFHDIRHDVGTKLLRKTGNMKLVQKALNHSDLKTTARYAHVYDEDIAAALSVLAKSQKKLRNTDGGAA